ncbi:hypothetical protein F5884DRAFT_886761 [Xylogone sp. PMI_703]|nr:hypothetical protein F5884DRAFT_886761 [Xylogone sp. PMI_703]
MLERATDTQSVSDGNIDRTLFVPSHTGSHVLPNGPLFAKLLRHARRNRLAIRDNLLRIEKTYGELLSDVLTYRGFLESALGEPVLHRIENGEEVYIGVLAAGGYEFTVAVLAVLALGAAVVPMTVQNPVLEVVYFIKKARQVAIIHSSIATDLARSVAQHFNSYPGEGLPYFDVLPKLTAAEPLSPYDMVLSSNKSLDGNAPGVVIFTSGTTGKPKGSVMRHSYTYECAAAIGDGYDLVPTDTLLHVLPVHHTTGLGTSFFPFLNVGACIEFQSGNFDAVWIWNRWREGGITVFSAVPTIYMRLQWHYEQNIASLPPKEKESYVSAANQLRALFCGSSALQEHVQRFWTNLRMRPILTRYGASEFPGCIKVAAEFDPHLPQGSVGTSVPGVELKLTEGDHGELLVKSPYMFAKYLHDEQATRTAHDDDGYFKTGDLARREGPYYFIVGRASVDIIKSGGYKISALEIERELLQLPYVIEAMVVGIDDEEFGQRVGAAIALDRQKCNMPVTINGVRDDLRGKLPSYKLPTALRIIDGELPKGPTGKVQKKILGPEYFPVPGWKECSDVQAWKQKPDRALSLSKL